MIPPFDERGNLPPGTHKASWTELKAAFGGSPWRDGLLVGMQEALAALRDAGCRTAYVDGSFVTTKAQPRDFDVCWDAVGVDPDALDPVLLDFSEGRRAQRERFGGELFPANAAADPGGTRFLDYFQHDRETGDLKGIVQLGLETV